MLPPSPSPSATPPEQIAALRELVQWQQLRIKDLEMRLFGRSSEKNRTAPDDNLVMAEIVAAAGALTAVVSEPPIATEPKPAKARTPKGPRPLDPALPREKIEVPAPELKQLICPVTGKPRQPGFVETLEVLARRPAQYYVKRYERTVYVSPAKTAPVCAAYRAHDGPVWFEYAKTKTPAGPSARLAAFRGCLQTDGAPGLADIGCADKRIVHLGCWAHARRYFVKAVDAGELGAADYLRAIDQLFRNERKLPEGADRQAMREKESGPLTEKLFAKSQAEQGTLAPRTRLGQAVKYLLGQRAPLQRCFEQLGSQLENNAVERAIRPLKIGAKNWLFIGHPDAGPRLANLFTLIENCRLVGADPETYLVDLIARLPEHPNKLIDELLPANWLKVRGVAIAPEPPPKLVEPKCAAR